MNEADKLRARQQAISYQRQAEVSGLRKDWMDAANAWKAAGNEDRYQECKLCAEMCKN